jgi:sugar phosphate isomerase/epimerase
MHSDRMLMGWRIYTIGATMLSVTTDYARDTGCPEPYLRRIAAAGFSHIHWCHHWHTDFVYSEPEIKQIGDWLSQYGLELNDLHGSKGVEKDWVSPREYKRLAGVELVKNRIHMAHKLGTDVVIIHVHRAPDEPGEKVLFWSQLRKSLDEVQPFALKRGVQIALENLGLNYATLHQVLSQYSPEYIGICYDSGHGHYTEGGLDFLDQIRDRLISIHLHDNQGSRDEHNLPFSGTIDWVRLTQLLAKSAYSKAVNLEVAIRNSGITDEAKFLSKAFECGTILDRMIEEARNNAPSPALGSAR